jgi:hypothetical protein
VALSARTHDQVSAHGPNAFGVPDTDIPAGDHARSGIRW